MKKLIYIFLSILNNKLFALTEEERKTFEKFSEKIFSIETNEDSEYITNNFTKFNYKDKNNNMINFSLLINKDWNIIYNNRIKYIDINKDNIINLLSFAYKDIIEGNILFYNLGKDIDPVELEKIFARKIFNSNIVECKQRLAEQI